MKRAELYVRMYVGVVEHPKILSVPREHRWALMDLLCYAKRNLTDGYVPAVVLDRLQVSREEVASLLWAGLLDDASDGYQIHDYTDYQIAKETVDARREAGRKGGEKSGIVRRAKQNEASGSRSSKQNEASGSTSDEPETETETETETEVKTIARRAVERDPSFDAFWSAYPRKAGKRTAQTAYSKALKRATAEQILDGLMQLIPSWTDPQYIPHPTTWLNRDGWLDDPAPQSGATAPLHGLAAQVDRYEQGTRFFA